MIVALGILAILPIARHRLRARTGEPLDRRQEGLAVAVSLRLLGGAHMVSLLFYIARPAWLAWAAMPLPAKVRWAGAGLALAAASLIDRTLQHLGKSLTDTVVTRQHHSLVTTGPYRWIRHPFYVGIALLVLANSLLTANLLVFVTAGAWFLLIVRRTRREEINLLARFGEDYRRYMHCTGRFLPRLWRPIPRDVSTLSLRPQIRKPR